MGLKMPYGEAKHVEIAFHIAVVKAITNIRTAKAKELEGTLFHAIPSANYRQEIDVDYLAFTRTNPRDAAVFLESCIKQIGRASCRERVYVLV